jgi:dsRNA-specific ribonuclease
VDQLIENELIIDLESAETKLFADYLTQLSQDALNASTISNSVSGNDSKLHAHLYRFKNMLGSQAADKGPELYIGVPLKRLGSFDYRQSGVKGHYTYSSLAQKPIPLAAVNLGLMKTLEQVDDLSWYSFEILDKIPSIFKLFERAVQTAEAQQYFDLRDADANLVYRAISTTAVDSHRNMGSTAIIGEVIVKAIHAIDQIAGNPASTATSLTTSKSSMLSLERVSSLQSLNPTLCFFLCPKSSTASKRQIYTSCMALVASAFLSGCSLVPAIKIVACLGICSLPGLDLWKESWTCQISTINTNMKVEMLNSRLYSDFGADQIFGKKSYISDQKTSAELISEKDSMIDHQEINSQTRIQRDIKSMPASAQKNDPSAIGKLEFLQKFILNYKFENEKLLVAALEPFSSNKDMQKLEYLGDIVIELLTLMIARNTMSGRGFEITPDFLSGIKIIVLSTEGLAGLFIYHKIHEFIPIHKLSKEIQASIAKYMTERDFSEKCRYLWWRTPQKAPKILADTLEAIFGAVFYDGGWNALLAVLEAIAGPMIHFAAENFDILGRNIIGDIIAFHRSQGSRL